MDDTLQHFNWPSQVFLLSPYIGAKSWFTLGNVGWIGCGAMWFPRTFLGDWAEQRNFGLNHEGGGGDLFWPGCDQKLDTEVFCFLIDSLPLQIIFSQKWFFFRKRRQRNAAVAFTLWNIMCFTYYTFYTEKSLNLELENQNPWVRWEIAWFSFLLLYCDPMPMIHNE